VWSAVPELRKQLAQLRSHLAEVRAHECEVLLIEVVADRFDERQVGKRELDLRAAPPQDVAAQLARAPGELGRQPGLADARLAGYENEASVAPIGGEERVLELREFLLPTDEYGRGDALEHQAIVAMGPRAEGRLSPASKPSNRVLLATGSAGNSGGTRLGGRARS
jgi:hypothetical protein